MTPILAAAMLAGLSLAGQALGQALADPTRPPDAVDLQQSRAVDDPSGRLESILLSPRRKLAVIDGMPVALGGRIGDATLIGIAPAQVVLREAGKDRVLKLHPGVEKKTRKPIARVSGDGGGSP